MNEEETIKVVRENILKYKTGQLNGKEEKEYQLRQQKEAK